jgi:hypothetical protein
MMSAAQATGARGYAPLATFATDVPTCTGMLVREQAMTDGAFLSPSAQTYDPATSFPSPAAEQFSDHFWDHLASIHGEGTPIMASPFLGPLAVG